MGYSSEHLEVTLDRVKASVKRIIINPKKDQILKQKQNIVLCRMSGKLFFDLSCDNSDARFDPDFVQKYALEMDQLLFCRNARLTPREGDLVENLRSWELGTKLEQQLRSGLGKSSSLKKEIA